MTERPLNDWILSYLKYVEHTESPIQYHTWIAMGVVSAALQRRVFMQWGHDTIYPNQYIILVGPSGQSRKGAALGIGRQFLNRLDIPMGGQSMTREALIRLQKESLSDFRDPDTDEILYQCPLVCVADELQVLLGQKDVGLLADLTDWYDSRDKWGYYTKTQGRDIIQGLCFTLLAGTAPDWLPTIFPQEAIGGGFTSRALFIVEGQKGKIVADPNATPINVELEEQLVEDLLRIYDLKGEMTFSKEAHDAYVEWYTKDETDIRNGKLPITDPKFGGYLARRATHIKKISMALSASRSSDRVITLADFNDAKTIMLQAERGMAKAFSSLGGSRLAVVTELVISYIIRHRVCKRSEILRAHYRDLDAWTMDQIHNLLIRMDGDIKIQILPPSDIRYIWEGEEP